MTSFDDFKRCNKCRGTGKVGGKKCGACNGTKWIKDESLEEAILFRRKSMLTLIVLIVINIFTPSSKTIAAMYLVPKIIENQKIQDITGKAGTVIEKKLDQWIEDFSKDASKE